MNRLRQLAADFRAARRAPVHPVTAVLGVLAIVAGGGVVQRFIQQQQMALGAAWADFQQLRAGAAQLAEAAAAPAPAGERCDVCGADHDADEYDHAGAGADG